MKKWFLAALLAPAFLATAQAGEEMPGQEKPEAVALSKPLVTDPAAWYKEDIFEAQLLSGAQFSPIWASERRTFNCAPSILRLGWMLNTPQGDSWFRGNVEALADLYGAAVLDGFGNYLIGPSFLVRYNFVRPGWRIIPYIQGGAGFVLNDAYRDLNQRLIGQVFEFTPQASVGLKYMINPDWSVNLEGMFHHISNADTASRNTGVNSVGALVGVSYIFKPRSE